MISGGLVQVHSWGGSSGSPNTSMVISSVSKCIFETDILSSIQNPHSDSCFCEVRAVLMRKINYEPSGGKKKKVNQQQSCFPGGMQMTELASASTTQSLLFQCLILEFPFDPGVKNQTLSMRMQV